MQQRQGDEGRRRSPFVAAVLSFLIPGLGQAYAGDVRRGVVLAAPVIVAAALLGGLVADAGTRLRLEASLASPTALLVVLALDALLFAYRLVAVVDAYRLAVNGPPPQRATRLAGLRLPGAPLSLAGLLAVLLVLPLAHVALARYDLIAYDLVTSIGGSGGNEPTGSPGTPSPASPGPSEASSPTATAEPSGQPWNGTDRLNILLLGVDHRPDGSYLNTDTMIVVSIDPVTRRVALLSLPRDTIDVPLAGGGTYAGKINGLWSAVAGNNPTAGEASRGYRTLMGALGTLYRLDIQYYVQVDFSGFKQVVDTLGGVTIDVQSPVQDDHFPLTDSTAIRVYIPPGFQHMDGAAALIYARSRHGSSDFDRAQRQQRVLLALRHQVDPLSLLAPGRLEAFVGALKAAVHSNIPPEMFPSLITLASSVDLDHARTLVFTPPFYETDDGPPNYTLTPFVDRIRRAVIDAFRVDKTLEASRAKIADEAATVWVLDGSGKVGQAGAVSDYLAYLGMESSIPTANGGRADSLDHVATEITVYNGAEAQLPETIRVLEATFGGTVATLTDPAVSADIVLITGSTTPKLVVPP
ncbi:MAG: LCP family protein [Candidatus Limnocylindrales bacterium]